MSSAGDMPIPLKQALRKLGQDIRDSRRRRRPPGALLAERTSMCRVTLGKIEKGDPAVSHGNYAMTLFVLSLLSLHGRLADLADVRADATGLALYKENLPQRIRRSSAKPKPNDRG